MLCLFSAFSFPAPCHTICVVTARLYWILKADTYEPFHALKESFTRFCFHLRDLEYVMKSCRDFLFSVCLFLSSQFQHRSSVLPLFDVACSTSLTMFFRRGSKTVEQLSLLAPWLSLLRTEF